MDSCLILFFLTAIKGCISEFGLFLLDCILCLALEYKFCLFVCQVFLFLVFLHFVCLLCLSVSYTCWLSLLFMEPRVRVCLLLPLFVCAQSAVHLGTKRHWWIVKLLDQGKI